MQRDMRLESLEIELAELKEEVKQLRTLFDYDPKIFKGPRLTPAQRKILGLLLRRNTVTPEQLATILYSGRAAEKDVPGDKVVTVHIYYLRKRLAPFGVEIKTLRGHGYYIATEHKKKLNLKDLG